MKIPTQPGRLCKSGPRRGRRRKAEKPRLPLNVYVILGCGGCVAGCKAGYECKPPWGYVHGACLVGYLCRNAAIVNRVNEVPSGKCLHCGKELATQKGKLQT